MPEADVWAGVPLEEKAVYCYHVAPVADALNQELREAGSSLQVTESDWLPDAIRALVDAVRKQERHLASLPLPTPESDREEQR